MAKQSPKNNITPKVYYQSKEGKSFLTFLKDSTIGSNSKALNKNRANMMSFLNHCDDILMPIVCMTLYVYTFFIFMHIIFTCLIHK